MGKQARVLVPATTANLGAGFDCMGMALELYNCFDFQLGSNEFSVTGEGQQELELDRGQLVYRAWDAAHAYRSRSAPSVKLHIESRIPIGRGLGSSATAVIAGLYAANHLGGLCLSTAELLSLATMIEGHPDNIAPALLGGLVVTAKEDNHSEVDYLVLDSCEELQVILAVPRFELSTSKARSVLPEKVPYKDAVFNVGRAALFIAAWTKKRWEVLGKAWLIDCISLSGRRWFQARRGLNCCSRGWSCGSGSFRAGPSVVALTIGNADEVGKVMQQAFIDHGIECEIIETRPAIKGAHLAG